jgi:hypothetical protein
MRLVLLALIAARSWAQPSMEIRSFSGPATDRLKEAERRLLNLGVEDLGGARRVVVVAKRRSDGSVSKFAGSGRR